MLHFCCSSGREALDARGARGDVGAAALKAATTRAPGTWFGPDGSFRIRVNSTTCEVSRPISPMRSGVPAPSAAPQPVSGTASSAAPRARVLLLMSRLYRRERLSTRGVQRLQEADMNIWDAFGVSPKTALLAAAAGLVVAVVMALVAFKRDRDHDRQSLNLDD
jgi:hypothetical protein